MTTTHSNKEWKGALRSKYYNGWHVLWIIFIVTSISVSIVFLYVAFCQPYCVLCIHIVSRVLTLTLFWSFQAFVFALIGFRKLLFQLVLLLLYITDTLVMTSIYFIAAWYSANTRFLCDIFGAPHRSHPSTKYDRQTQSVCFIYFHMDLFPYCVSPLVSW